LLNKPINILFVDHESTLGGAELSMVDIVNKTKSDTISLSAVIRSKGKLELALKNAGAKNVYFINTDSWRWWESGFVSRIKLIISIPLQVYRVIVFYRLFKKLKPDIIHFNLTRLIEPLVAGKLAGITTIMHFREDPEHNNLFWGGEKALYKFLHLTNYWIANSNSTLTAMLPYKGNKEPVVILNGVDIKRFVPTLNGKKERFSVLMLAGLVPWKNHELFIKIANEVIKSNSEIDFYIAGKGNADFENFLKQEVINLNLEDRIKFIGFVENTVELLNSMHLLLHTSGKETFGRVFVEAMACKIPVIATKGGSADEIVENGISGFTYEKEEVLSAARQIIELSVNKDLYLNVAEAARKRVVQEYSLEKLSKNIRNLYESILIIKK
jgi:glycosyltransferase involved in cell wall biosynthesis